LNGHFVYDDVTIGSGPGSITIQNQKFGNVEEEHNIFRSNYQAIVGLAYPALAQPGVVPVFDNMMKQDLLKDNLFAFYLGSSALGEESDLTFGYYDKTKFVGKIQWNPVVFRYMYGMRLDDVLIGGRSLGICGSDRDCIVTVDSGSSLLAMPNYAFNVLKEYGLPTRHGHVQCDGV